MSESEKHNDLAQRFVHDVVAETRTMPQLMVVTESAILSVMLTLRMRHGFDAAKSAVLVEAAVQRATERFAEIERRP